MDFPLPLLPTNNTLADVRGSLVPRSTDSKHLSVPSNEILRGDYIVYHIKSGSDVGFRRFRNPINSTHPDEKSSSPTSSISDVSWCTNSSSSADQPTTGSILLALIIEKVGVLTTMLFGMMMGVDNLLSASSPSLLNRVTFRAFHSTASAFETRPSSAWFQEV